MKVGIGFVTGRKSFQKVLRTNIYNWKESGLTDDVAISLNLLVAYDLDYSKTKREDYTNINKDLQEEIHSSTFIGNTLMKEEIKFLVANGIINKRESHLLFGEGYAAKRNAVLYQALKQKLDCVIFLDDDEYPMAVTNTKGLAIWSGQFVLSEHLKNIENADITHGYHCGYVSPIPYISFNQQLSENDFQQFIEALSNDIINWDNLKTIMNNGGITYADTQVLVSNMSLEAVEVNGAKFISGSNLCINLKNPTRIFPFYNPPDARGEDTFLSTCLTERKVMRVPCYNFHDGFLTYRHLLEGVLPIKLKYIKADNKAIINRFYKACIGWVRYKPLLVYITDRPHYDQIMVNIRQNLVEILPKICLFFDAPEFMHVLSNFDKYQKNAEKHFVDFEETKKAWAKIMTCFSDDSPGATSLAAVYSDE